jgi:hypothetical protein
MNHRNVLNNILRPCSGRNGLCSNDISDAGTHISFSILRGAGATTSPLRGPTFPVSKPAAVAAEATNRSVLQYVPNNIFFSVIK